MHHVPRDLTIIDETRLDTPLFAKGGNAEFGNPMCIDAIQVHLISYRTLSYITLYYILHYVKLHCNTVTTPHCSVEGW